MNHVYIYLFIYIGTCKNTYYVYKKYVRIPLTSVIKVLSFNYCPLTAH
jgi:hypothetical protein